MNSCNFINRVNSHTPEVEVHTRPKIFHFGVVRAKLFCLKCFVPVTGLECSYGKIFIPVRRVYYSLAVWRFKPILSAGLRFHSHSFGGLRLRNYRAVAGNHKFSSRFSGFACFCGGYLNRVKRLRRLSGNFILLKTSLFNKGLRFRVRLVRATLCFPSHVGGVGR